ncbi:MAG: hypothetical protein ACOCW8_02065 [bacterium]
MIESNTTIDVSQFREEFGKRFKNFCHKAPMFLSFIMQEGSVELYQTEPVEHNDTQLTYMFTHKFHFGKSVKENIHTIKQKLVSEYYPVIENKQFTHIPPTTEELNALVRTGVITLDEAPTYTKTVVKSTPYLVEKVIMNRDEIHIVNLETGEKRRYEMKKPVSVFLRKLQRGQMEDPGRFFFKNSERIFSNYTEAE